MFENSIYLCGVNDYINSLKKYFAGNIRENHGVPYYQAEIKPVEP
jgi:hypothetical protein